VNMSPISVDCPVKGQVEEGREGKGKGRRGSEGRGTGRRGRWLV